MIVAGDATAQQAAALLDLPDRPLVHRRRGGNCRVTFPVAATDVGSLLAVVRAVESVGLRAVRLVDDDWVTLGGIADRLGCTRERVRLWSVGRLGPGGFPPPLNPGQQTLFYSWYAVATWLRGYRPKEVATPDAAPVTVNLALQLRQIGPAADVHALAGQAVGTHAGLREG